MDKEHLRRLPKALLHDHLDGGVRVSTVIDLAREVGYEQLPSDDPPTLATWFHQKGSPSLEVYLASFRHTVAVMQTPESLTRIAYEAVVDLAADGVVYAEVRFGPSLHTGSGLTLEEVVAATAEGIRLGEHETGTVTRLILVALRDQDDSETIARLAVASADQGVVAFDLAGPELGYPPDVHQRACRIAADSNVALTIHAGEGDGPNSIWRALHRCGANRIGHGVRIAEDVTFVEGEVSKVGSLAGYVRDLRVPLEVSVTSNLDTGMYPDAAAHPVGALHRAGFTVTLNTDNRLMSRTTLTDEFALMADHHGFGLEDFRKVTERTVLAGFAELPVREAILRDLVLPAYS